MFILFYGISVGVAFVLCSGKVFLLEILSQLKMRAFVILRGFGGILNDIVWVRRKIIRMEEFNDLTIVKRLFNALKTQFPPKIQFNSNKLHDKLNFNIQLFGSFIKIVSV